MSEDHFFIQFQFRSTTTNSSKWQTTPYTEKILQQLTQEPEVLIERKSIVHYPENHRNVTHISENVKNTGLTFDEDVSITSPHDSTMSNNVETSKKNKRNRGIKSQEALKQRLHKLFGSSLDDIEPRIPKPVGIKMEDRRHSLPVSINMKNRCLNPLRGLNPLRVIRKRKSEPDPTTAFKIKKLHENTPSTRSLHTEYRTASEFVIPTVYTATARRIETELKTATKTKTPILGKTETVKAKKSVPAFIDLTKEDVSESIEFDGIRVEIVKEVEQNQVKEEVREDQVHSEKAKVPISSSPLSMPLLSPVSAAVPAQVEAILPQETMQTDLSRVEASNATSLQRPSPTQNQPEITVQILHMDKPETDQNQKKSEVRPTKKTVVEERSQFGYQNPLPHISYRVPFPPPTVTPQQQNPSLLPHLQQSAYRGYQQDMRKINHSLLEDMVRMEKRNVSSTIPNQTSVAKTQSQVSSNVAMRNQQTIHQQQQAIFAQQKQTTSVPQSVQQQQYTTPAVRPQQQSIPAKTISNQWFQAQQPGNQAPPMYQQQQLPNLSQRVTNTQHSTTQQANPQKQGLPNITQQLHSQQGFLNITQQLQSQQQRLADSTELMNLPQLVQLLQSTQPQIQLISNAACAEKMLPHLFRVVSWRKFVYQFYDETKTFFSANELRESSLKFRQYTDSVLQNFGRKLVKDLSNVDVSYFSINTILGTLSSKMMETDASNNMYRICTLVNLMVRGFEAECNTPFLKKFYSAIKLCNERMEQVMLKKKEVPKFTILQLQQLETQIRQYWLIQNWVNNQVTVQNQGERQINVPAASPRSSQQATLDTRPNQKRIEVCNQTRTQQNTLPVTNDLQIIPLMQTPQNPQRINPTQRRNSNFGNTSFAQNSNTLEIVLHSKTQGNVSRTNTSENTSVQTNPQGQLRPTVTPTSQQTNSCLNTAAASNVQEPSENKGAQDNFSVIVTPVLQIVTDSSSSDSRDAMCGTKVPENSKKATEGGADKGNVQTCQKTCNNREKKPEVASEIDVELVEVSDVKHEIKDETVDDVIDLTWIDDADEQAIEVILECKTFPFKSEDCADKEEESAAREVLSPTDSGLGSPVAQSDNDGFKCLCGNKAIYVCACKSSMYCSEVCQEKDWVYHQKLCHKMKS